jgi:hypothetical protein
MKHIFKYIFITSLLAQSLFPSNENQFTKIFKNLTLKLKDTFKNPRNNKKTALAIGYGLFCVLNNSWRLRKGNKEQIKIGNQIIQSYKGKWNWINYVDIGYLTESAYKKCL